MNALTHWNPIKALSELKPFREADDLHHQLSRFFGGPAARHGGSRENITLVEWAPLVDITEDDKEYAIKAELPEVNKADVKVRVEDGVLHLSGERRIEKEEKGRRYHRVERAYGSFTRSFALPDDADPKQVHAEFKDGVLTVRVLKNPSAGPKTIKVKFT